MTYNISQKTLRSILLFLTLCFLSKSTYATDHRVSTEFIVTPSATVAHLMSSKARGCSGFHLPDTPHFRHFYDIRSPRHYDAFYQLNAGRITLGSFIRFVDHGHTLFSNLENRKAYRKALREAVKARKDYAARTTKANLRHLERAESTVLTLLKTLPLHDPDIRARLEDILSTPLSKGIFQRIGALFISWFVLPFRASTKTLQTSSPNTIETATINRPSILATVASYTVLSGVPLAAALATLSIPFGFRSFGYSSFGTFLRCLLPPWAPEAVPSLLSYIVTKASFLTITLLAGAFSSIKLAPEPGGGIKVTITESYLNPLPALHDSSYHVLEEALLPPLLPP